MHVSITPAAHPLRRAGRHAVILLQPVLEIPAALPLRSVGLHAAHLIKCVIRQQKLVWLPVLQWRSLQIVLHVLLVAYASSA